MKPAPFTYHMPASVDEAVALLAEFGPQDAGYSRAARASCRRWPFAWRPGASHRHQSHCRTGGTHRDGQGHHDRRLRAPCRLRGRYLPGATGALLRKVVDNIAHVPIRTRGTFCGSVANADPASEWCCVMAALDGTVVLKSQRGERRVKAAEFYQGVMTTALEEDEMIVACELPLLSTKPAPGLSNSAAAKAISPSRWRS